MFLSSFTSFSQDKTIYITLDISGSMHNQKYEYGNYGAQVISAMNTDNEVVLIVGYKNISISGKKGLSKIQKDDSAIGDRNYGTEIADIMLFNEVFDPNKKNQEIFIIGDGDWNRVKEIEDAFKKHVDKGNLRVTFLATLTDLNFEYNFEKYLKEINTGKIYKTDSDKLVIQKVNTIVEEITGVSGFPKKKIDKDGKCLTFSPELNIKEVVFMYQDNKGLNAIPKIINVEIAGASSKIELLGQPSTESFQSYGGLVSSNIYKLRKKINAGTNVKVCFDKKIDLNKLKIFPVTDIAISSLGIVVADSDVVDIDLNTKGVCKNNEEAIVQIGFDQASNEVANKVLQRTKVTIISEGKTYKAKYNNGLFEATIPLTGETTTYRVESELKGYFRINSGQKSIVKSAACKPVEPPKPPPLPPITMPPLNFGTLEMGDSGCGGKIRAQMVDSISNKSLDPTLFDIEVDNNYIYLFKKVSVTILEDNWIELNLEPRGFWCSCFMPDEVKFNFTSKPKEALTEDGKQYRETTYPLIIKINKTETWSSRCSWLLLSMLISLGLIIYLIFLSRKKRFRKGAKIVQEAPSVRTIKSLNPTYIKTDFKLRKKGFAAWLNRWINPFTTENIVRTFETAGGKSFHFSASRSPREVFFPKSNFDPSTMSYLNYDEYDNNKEISLDENSPLTINHRRRGIGKISYFLNYTYPKRGWNDIATFKFVVGVFILLLLGYLVFSTVLIISSIF